MVNVLELVVQTAITPPFLLCSLLHSSQLYKNDTRNNVMDRDTPFFFRLKHYNMCIVLHIIRAHCIFTCFLQLQLITQK